MSVNVTVVYYLSETGQRAAALAGLKPSAVQVLEIEPTPELVALATPTPAGGLLLGIGGAARIRSGEPGGYGRTEWTDRTAEYAGGPIPADRTVDVVHHFSGRTGPGRGDPVPPPRLDAPLTTAAEVLAAVDADRLAVAAALEEAAAKEAARKAAAAESEQRERDARLAKERERIPAAFGALRELVAEADRLGVAVRDDLRGVAYTAPDPGTDAARMLLSDHPTSDLRKAVRKAAEHAAMVAWAAEHGSDRLRASFDLGVDATRLYQDERLGVERPGWVWDRDGILEQEPRNPPTEALRVLREARAVEPESRLVWTGFGFIAGGVDFLGRRIWLDRHVLREGAVTPIPRVFETTDDEDDE